jgi:hypothetical protein
MRRVLGTEPDAALYALRQQLIEPVFTNTKFNRRMERFHRRGRAACRTEWPLLDHVFAHFDTPGLRSRHSSISLYSRPTCGSTTQREIHDPDKPGLRASMWSG